VTMPRRRMVPRRLLRATWLALHGVRLHAYAPRQVETLFHGLGARGWSCAIDVLPDVPDTLWLVARRTG